MSVPCAALASHQPLNLEPEFLAKLKALVRAFLENDALPIIQTRTPRSSDLAASAARRAGQRPTKSTGSSWEMTGSASSPRGKSSLLAAVSSELAAP